MKQVYKDLNVNRRLGRVKSTRTDFFKENPQASVIASKLIPDRRRPNEQPRNDGVRMDDDSIFNEMIKERARKNLDTDTIIRLNPDIRLIRETLVSCIRSPLTMEDDKLLYKTTESALPLSLLNALIEPVEDYFTYEDSITDELSDHIADALINRGASALAIVPEASLDDLINKTGNISTENMKADIDRHFFDVKSGILKSEPGFRLLGNPTPPERNATTPSLEWFGDGGEEVNQKIGDYLYITDNPTQLRLNHLNEAYNRVRMQNLARRSGFGRIPRRSAISKENEHSVIKSGLVSNQYGNGAQDETQVATAHNIESIQKALYRPRRTNRRYANEYSRAQIVKSASEASRSSIGHPLIIPLLNESTIPVFVPGNPKKHIGYFIICDGYGQPLNVTQELRRFQDSGFGSLAAENVMNMTSSILSQINTMQNGFTVDNDTKMTERLRLYTELLEANVMNRVKNGLRGMSVKMKYSPEIMRLLFMRQLSNEMTHIVFMSAEQVAYLAFEFDENGMGVSMIDGIKQIATLRTMANFANFMASVRNAVGRTKVTLNIDERDPDPEKSAAILQDEYLRAQAGVTPTDVSSSSEMFRVIRQMGLTFEIQGNKRIPNTSVNVEDYQSQKQMIDNDYMDRLEKQLYMGMIVTPEMVDATQASDFAITKWTSNQLFGKRIKKLQKIVETFVKRYVEISTMSDGDLINKLQEIIESNKEIIPPSFLERGEGDEIKSILYQDIIEEFMSVLEIKLPSPESTKLDVQMEDLRKYTEGLDVALNAWMDKDFIESGLPDDQKDNYGKIISSYKAYFLRMYLMKNNVFPELEELTRPGTEDLPAMDMSKEMITHMTSLANNFGDFESVLKMRREQWLERIVSGNPVLGEAIGAPGGDSSTSSDVSETASEDTPPDDNNSEFGELPPEPETITEPPAEGGATDADASAAEQPPAPPGTEAGTGGDAPPAP